MLADLDFRSVKLDRSMTRNIATNRVSQMMVRDIAKICDSRGMLLIAEGVETQAQASALLANGCFYAQGYFYGRPMPVDEFEKNISQGRNAKQGRRRSMAQAETKAPREAGSRHNDDMFVVGIGASAGGLEALQQFFRFMPSGSGLSFVVIQHLAPDYKSLMADILGKYTQMTVLQAEDGMAVEENTVYLIPPKKNITYHSGRLFLRDYVQGTLNHPIDIFFNSLAEEKKEHAIAVVLSGTGSDGTGGIKTTREKGGLTIVQEPSTAKFDGMPRSAIATGVVDYVLSPRDIADELLHYAQHHAIVEPEDETLFTDEESFSHIYAVLKKVRGIDFTHYKRTTVLRRIERRMVVTHSMSLAEYARVLDNSPDEVNVLVKEILIGVTNFFRDPTYFEKLKERALYPIVQNAREDEPIRVWSAGCSTGEEAYSIAILFAEILEELHLRRDIKIFATDIDVQAIEQAGKGVFAESIIEDVSPERLSRFFIKRNDQYVIAKSIRRMIIFAPHNMLSDPPFGKLDLISCRNVMIYFQPVLQRSLFAIFHSALKNGGYLFLGKSETANEYADVFKPACSAEKIYIHNSSARPPTSPRRPSTSPAASSPCSRAPSACRAWKARIWAWRRSTRAFWKSSCPPRWYSTPPTASSTSSAITWTMWPSPRARRRSTSFPSSTRT